MFDDTLQSRPWVLAHRTELQALLPYGWSNYLVKDDVCAGLARLGVPCQTARERRLAWQLLYERGLLEAKGEEVRLAPWGFEFLHDTLKHDREPTPPRPWITEVASVLTGLIVIAHGLLTRVL